MNENEDEIDCFKNRLNPSFPAVAAAAPAAMVIVEWFIFFFFSVLPFILFNVLLMDFQILVIINIVDYVCLFFIQNEATPETNGREILLVNFHING